jgi:predicted DNA-binding protein
VHGIALQCIEQEAVNVDSQLTLRLPGELAEKLDRSARRLKRKRSDVVRQALEQFLETEPDLRPIERVRDLLGSVDSGVPDLGQRHRDYLIKRLRRGK